MPPVTAFPIRAEPRHRPQLTLPSPVEGAALRVVPWLDPVADPHGVHPCSRYVELYWLGTSSVPAPPGCCAVFPTGSEVHPDGFDLDSLRDGGGRWDWASAWGRTRRSAGHCNGSAPSNWPGPTDRRVWPYAPASRRSPCATSAGSPNPAADQPPAVDGRAAPTRARADAPARPATGVQRTGRAGAHQAGRRAETRRGPVGRRWQFHPAVEACVAQRRAADVRPDGAPTDAP